jgi:beta-lactamase regulating signal transducer with metallopeptidase domain
MPTTIGQCLDLLWQMSWQAAAIAVLVLLLQHTAGRVVPQRWRHALWMLVLLRLLMPALPQSRFSLFSFTGLPRQEKQSPSIELPPSQFTTLSLELINGPHSRPQTSREVKSLMPFRQTPFWRQSFYLGLIWSMIAAAVLLFRIVAQLKFLRRLGLEDHAIPARAIRLLKQCCITANLRRVPGLQLTNLIQAPAVTGLFRSRILLPVWLAEQLSDNDLKLVLLHELTHITCADVAIDWLWASVQALHWFNPILWLCTPIRRNDRELARDEMVLSITGKSQAPRYGQLLIELSQPMRLPIFCPGLIGMLSGKRRLQRRIRVIAQFDRHRWFASSTGLILMAVAGCCVLTAPPQSAATKPSVTATAPTSSDEYADLPDEPVSAQDRLTLTKLNQPLKGQIRFNSNKLSDVLDYLRDTTGTHMYVDWPALQRAGVSREAPVTARLNDIKLSKALDLIFKSVENDTRKLGYAVNEGMITISSRAELDKNTVTHRYDINDLLFIARDYNNQPDLSKINASQSALPSGPVTKQPDRASRVDDIKRYVMDNVEPDSWKENGGESGAISSSPLRAVLLITQTPRAHRKIQAVLDDLRKSRGVQVSIESRNICLTDAMESKLPANLRSRLAAVRNAGRFRRDQFLTDGELTQLIQAVQENKDATLLTAPRLTLFSGQIAVLVVATQQAYVADMKKVPATTTQPSHWEPIPATTTATGVTLKVTSCASPDGATVFVDLHDQIALLKLIPEQYGTDPTAGKIQRPVLDSFKVDAACGIPNRLTLLMSGQYEIDSGDPAFNADSPDKTASNAEVEKLRADMHSHEYLLVKPTILHANKQQAPLLK